MGFGSSPQLVAVGQFFADEGTIPVDSSGCGQGLIGPGIPDGPGRLGVGLQPEAQRGLPRRLLEQFSEGLVSFPAFQQSLDMSYLGDIFRSRRGPLAIERMNQIRTTAITATATAAPSAAATASVAPATLATAAALASATALPVVATLAASTR